MRNIKAFLVALLIFCITVPMFHLGIKKELPGYELSYGTWINEAKFQVRMAWTKCLQAVNPFLFLVPRSCVMGKNRSFMQTQFLKMQTWSLFSSGRQDINV